MWRMCLVLMLFGSALLPMVPAGETSNERPAAADLEFFEKKVRPLLVRRCYECHSGEAKSVWGGLRLDSRAGLLEGGDSGPAVIPEKPNESLLVEAVGYKSDHVQMPPEGKLPDQEVALLTEWVRRGAPFPAGDEPAPVRQKIDFETGREFWSFQPPRLTDPPAVADADWPRERIDAFVLAELERRELGPSPPADRHTLIRRATFDLVGLPPTPDETEAFVNDPAPDAWPRLVERLLASSHYGERWGRHWLDVARYADVLESWVDVPAQPWLYRDWVVRAFNDDLPYDEFVRRQLATDLLDATGPEDIPALGFLGLSPSYWKELQLDKEVIKAIVAEEWEERLDALGRTFLGLTIGCARCHDHKFDPIGTEDYYALAGVLASIRHTARPIIPEPEAQAAQEARDRVRALSKKLKELQADKTPSKETRQQIESAKSWIDKIEQTTPHYHTPLAHAVEDASLSVVDDGPHRTKLEYRPGEAQDLAVQVRGNPSNPGRVVPRRFLTVLEPVSFTEGSGRRELAEAIVTSGSPLSARVIVNRVWTQHFGRGLVETPSDFGAQGSRPTHPELLDDLTARFIEHGWSLKWLHREIMLSAAYQQASRHDPAGQAADPANRWLWRMNRRRLDVEAWRDAMLAVTGRLDQTLGGPPHELTDPANVRRTLYGKVVRRQLSDLLRLYDFPDPTAHSPGRELTTTPLQQLLVLNSPFFEQQSSALANRLTADSADDLPAAIHRAYDLLYARPATDREVQLGVEFLTSATENVHPTPALWRQYAQALLGSNEFLFAD